MTARWPRALPFRHAYAAAPDRGVRRRRVLDGVGEHAARRLRAGADRRRAPAGLLPADRERRRRPLRRPLLPRVLRRRGASRRTSRCSGARPASAIRARTCSRRTSCTSAAAASCRCSGPGARTGSTWRCARRGRRASSCAAARPARCAGSHTSLSGFHEGPARCIEGLGFLPWSNAVHYDDEPGRRDAFHEAVARRAAAGLRRRRRRGAALRRDRAGARSCPRGRGRGRAYVSADGDGGRVLSGAAGRATSGAPCSRGWSAGVILAMGGGGFTMGERTPALDRFVLDR